ncbi:hypothetical protein [Lonsdalea populi]|uniref:hypothetical protein n=1 Tax=Lonsdalea populi TaxID=1172565 RepID=UPI000A1DE74E|nr:hypothetical protein [Lonsdalea populi]OSN01291.1 hypothetical protein AU499_07195 [Lonsdalea populi]QPQ24979.1 hypothetical protein I6N93_04035 [Lonsdalea populi]RAT43950.1 hypothetical protein AU494_08025 [Lonsdalea populi]RAT45105.1 hypothetical protein AU495_06260 [Lonsdalea populi]RAT57527.1 hypothetical protein AU500_05840 [Lonsdalea populi]
MKASEFGPILLVKPKSYEWHYMWSKLAKHESNRQLPDPTVADNGGEIWQYMETVETRFLWFGKRYIHRFRHRLHPASDYAKNINVPASNTFNPNDSDNAFYHRFI